MPLMMIALRLTEIEITLLRVIYASDDAAARLYAFAAAFA